MAELIRKKKKWEERERGGHYGRFILFAIMIWPERPNGWTFRLSSELRCPHLSYVLLPRPTHPLRAVA
jgi:hypothetical protein